MVAYGKCKCGRTPDASDGDTGQPDVPVLAAWIICSNNLLDPTSKLMINAHTDIPNEAHSTGCHQGLVQGNNNYMWCVPVMTSP